MMLATTLLLAVLAPSPQEPPVAEMPPAAENEATPAPDTTAAPTSAESAETHIAAGLAAYRKRRFKAAETHFQAAVDADPRSAAAHYYLGYAIYKQVEPKRPFHPDKQKAAEHFAQAYAIDPAFKPNWRS